MASSEGKACFLGVVAGRTEEVVTGGSTEGGAGSTVDSEEELGMETEIVRAVAIPESTVTST